MLGYFKPKSRSCWECVLPDYLWQNSGSIYANCILVIALHVSTHDKACSHVQDLLPARTICTYNALGPCMCVRHVKFLLVHASTHITRGSQSRHVTHAVTSANECPWHVTHALTSNDEFPWQVLVQDLPIVQTILRFVFHHLTHLWVAGACG